MIFANSVSQTSIPVPEPIWTLKANMLKQSSALRLYRGEIPVLGGLENPTNFCRRALTSAGHDEKARGVMLLGVSGSGKSAFCKSLGHGVHRPLLVLDIGALMGSLVGQTESALRKALKQIDAMRCTDSENARYALGSICLRGARNQIISTDGRQALVQDGFALPFESDVLCPVSRIFGSKDLREIGNTVRIGVTGDYVFFNVGSVNFWLRKVDGKFPQLDQFGQNIQGHTWLHIDPTDAAFAAERIDALPGKDKQNDPVFVALGGSVAIRGHDASMQNATELRLVKSRYEGTDVVMAVNRKFLKNALDLGVNRIALDPKEKTPLVGYGNGKMFVVMPLETDEPKADADKITVLASIGNSSVTTTVKTDKPMSVTPAKS